MKTESKTAANTASNTDSRQPAAATSGPLAGYRDTDASGAFPIAAHTLEGASVRATDQAEVGHLADLLLDLAHGRITHALLVTADGRDDRVVAIPWSALSPDTEGKGLRVAASAEQVFAAPDFDREHAPASRDPHWADAIERHFGSRA